jgi:hypothetical protein
MCGPRMPLANTGHSHTDTCGCGDALGSCGADGVCRCPEGYLLLNETLTCVLGMPPAINWF